MNWLTRKLNFRFLRKLRKRNLTTNEQIFGGSLKAVIDLMDLTDCSYYSAPITDSCLEDIYNGNTPLPPEYAKIIFQELRDISYFNHTPIIAMLEIFYYEYLYPHYRGRTWQPLPKPEPPKPDNDPISRGITKIWGNEMLKEIMRPKPLWLDFTRFKESPRKQITNDKIVFKHLTHKTNDPTS